MANRVDRRRRAREDEKALAGGINPASSDPGAAVALARQLYALFERAKRSKTIDPALRFLYASANTTLSPMFKSELACGKGCSHCCHTWVSASAPEVLFAAKAIRQRMDAAKLAQVQTTHRLTANLTFEDRARRSIPCPLLEADVCGVYEARPVVCRFAASTDALVCRRIFREHSREPGAMPAEFQTGRTIYGVVTTAALVHARLPHYYYEFNAALACALSREDAEEAWLSGEDIFAAVGGNAIDLATHPQLALIYARAFD